MSLQIVFNQFQNVTPDIITAIATLAMIDLIVGILQALKNKNFDPNKVLWGSAQKVVEILIVYSTSILDTVAFNGTPAITSLVSTAFILMEFLSITRNAAALGVKVPNFLVSLVQTKLETLEKTNTPIKDTALRGE